jgi:alpha-tubulin suppressor-like RCC1 family protein
MSQPPITSPEKPAQNTRPGNWKRLLYGFGSAMHGNIANFGFKNSQFPQEMHIAPNPAKIISNASDTAFLLTTDGQLFSWGGGNNHVLGTSGSTLDTSCPQPVPIPPISSLSVSNTHAAAISTNGDVYTWGNKSLGRGILESSLNNAEKGTPTRINIPTDSINTIGVNNGVPTQQGSISYLYGGDNNGQNSQNFGNPKPISIGVGCNHTMVAMSNGDVYGWGLDCDGAIGLNGGDKHKNHVLPTKVSIPFGEKIDEVVCGKRHTLFRTINGDLYGCGDNTHGQIGVIGKNTNLIRVPEQILFPQNDNNSQNFEQKNTQYTVKVKQMSAGPIHSCIVSTDNDLYCWGSNTNGQLGLSLLSQVTKSVGQMASPVKNQFFSENNIKIEKVKCGASHTAVLDTNGQLWVFGDGKDSQLSSLYHTSLGSSYNDMPIPLAIDSMHELNNNLYNHHNQRFPGLQSSMMLSPPNGDVKDGINNKTPICGVNKPVVVDIELGASTTYFILEEPGCQ